MNKIIPVKPCQLNHLATFPVAKKNLFQKRARTWVFFSSYKTGRQTYFTYFFERAFKINEEKEAIRLSIF
jgi:hypothetical protein